MVQGPLLGLLMRSQFPEVAITEAHPKALLWLLGVARVGDPVASVTGRQLAAFVDCAPSLVDHERDAVLAGLAAAHMIMGSEGWVDLVASEPEPLFIAGSVRYCFPLSL